MINAEENDPVSQPSPFTLRDAFNLQRSAYLVQLTHYRNAIKQTAELTDFAVPFGCSQCKVTAKFVRTEDGELQIHCPLCRTVEDFDVAAQMAEGEQARETFKAHPVELAAFLELTGDDIDDTPVPPFVFLVDPNIAKPPMGFN